MKDGVGRKLVAMLPRGRGPLDADNPTVLKGIWKPVHERVVRPSRRALACPFWPPKPFPLLPMCFPATSGFLGKSRKYLK